MPAWLALVMSLFLGGAILWRYKRIRPSLKWAGIAAAAACWSLATIHGRLDAQLPATFDRCDWRITGHVVDLPVTTEIQQRFDLRTVSAKLLRCPQGQTIREHRSSDSDLLRLTLYDRDDQQPELRPGQLLDMTVRLRSPRGRAGPGMFNHEAYLLQRGYAATGYVRELHHLTETRKRSFDRWRFTMSNWLQNDTSLLNKPLFQALLVGDKRNLTNAQWETMQRTGTVHLVITSGLHIGFAALFGAFFGALLWLPSRLGNRPQWSAWGAIATAFFYSGMAGFQMATIRAAAAVIAFSLSVSLSRFIPVRDRFLVSLCTVLVMDPLAPLSHGFWLSFSAVTALLLISLRRDCGQQSLLNLRSLVLAQFGITLLITPLLLRFIGEVSPWSPLINLVAVPLLGFVILPLMVMAVLVTATGMGDFLWIAADVVAFALWRMLAFFAELPSNITFSGMAHWQVWAALLGAGLLLVPASSCLRLPAMILWFCSLLYTDPETHRDRLVVLDVGQGLGAFLQLGSDAIVYDTGQAFPGGYDSVRDAMLPALRTFNVKRISTVIISHGDIDHAGSLSTLRTAFPDAVVYTGEPQRLQGSGSVHDCTHRSWQVGEVRLEIRRPDFSTRKANNRSCTFHATSPYWSLLFAGDLEFAAERVWLAQSGARQADILVASHHGSAGASGEPFLDAVAPGWIVYSAGWLNRFRHPSEAACRRGRQTGAILLSTARHGAIVFELPTRSSDHLKVVSWRCHSTSWWQKTEPVDYLTDTRGLVGLLNPCP